MDNRRSKGFEDGTRAEGSLSVSLLVRARVEEASGTTTVKVFVRNLQTGREQYLSDPSHLGELVLRQLRAWKGESDSETGDQPKSRTGS